MKKDEYRDPLQYERVKERARKDSALRSLAGREIAPLPAVANPARRASASASLLVFCKLYFAQKFKKPFGQNHLALIDALQNVIADGGKQAIAMPRGTGKTTISTVAAIWALLTARRRFVVIVASNTKEARKLLKSIVQIIGSNQLLCQDFPEICVPVRALRGSALLARGQLFYGEPTNVQISADIFRLPTIPASPASGSTVCAYGVKAAIRGLSAEAPDGSTIRPDFLFLDDLQTDSIAINPKRVADLEEIVASTLEGLVENGADVAAVQTCTVKAPDDYADRVLNRELNPRWNGLRFASLAAMPERLDLWRQYRSLWFESETRATAFYKKNAEDMRRGAVVTWPEAYSGKRYLDALEYYMVRWCDNERAFYSEQQNQPLELGGGTVKLAAKTISRKLNGYSRGIIPENTAKITAAIDVHGDLLYYVICAWRADFTGYVVDYGTFPEQKRKYFQKNDGGLDTLKTEFPELTADGRLQRGLTILFQNLRSATFKASFNSNVEENRNERPGSPGWRYELPLDHEESRPLDAYVTNTASDQRERKAQDTRGSAIWEPPLGVDRIVVDQGWKPEVVENAIRAVDTRLIVPAKGQAVLAKSRPMAQWPRRNGRVFGWHVIDEKPPKGSLRLFLHDANYWKTKVHEALSLEPGESGSLSLFGHDAQDHKMLSEQLSAEVAKLVEYGANRVVEWSPNVNRPDNHFFDATVGCFVAASSLGLLTDDDPRKRTTKNI